MRGTGHLARQKAKKIRQGQPALYNISLMRTIRTSQERKQFLLSREPWESLLGPNSLHGYTGDWRIH